MTTFTIIALAFLAGFALAVIIAALTPRAPKGKPEGTEYRGPLYTAHGREIGRHGRRVL